MHDKETLLFSVGPIEIEQDIMDIGSKKIPYFRTEEFSNLNLSICEGLKKISGTSDSSEVALLTASGTGAMEAAIINTFGENDNLLVIVGGGFGKRFTEICDLHGINYTVLELEQGQALTKEKLYKYRDKGFTGVLVNAHETSTCVYYDLPMIGEFCRKEDCILVVDAISSFLADEYYMDKWNIDITIISSQKALTLPPGLSMLIINKRTVDIINKNKIKSLYFNLQAYFKDIKRGQTPFTPAVGILIQLKARIDKILRDGSDNIINHTKLIAEDFRSKISKLPFEIPSESLSNASTPLKPTGTANAYDIFIYLAEKYNIYVCPNGGNLKDKLFRVGHMGNLSVEDNNRLINALEEMKGEGLI